MPRQPTRPDDPGPLASQDHLPLKVSSKGAACGILLALACAWALPAAGQENVIIVTASRVETFPLLPEVPIVTVGEAEFGGASFSAPLNLTLSNGITLDYSVISTAIDEDLDSTTDDVFETAIRYANDFGDLPVANFGFEQVFAGLESEIPIRLTHVGGGFASSTVEVEVDVRIGATLTYDSTILDGFSGSISYVASGDGDQDFATANLSAGGLRSGTPGFSDAFGYSIDSPTLRVWSISDFPITLAIEYAVTPGETEVDVSIQIDEGFSTFYSNVTGATVFFPGISIWDSSNTARFVSIRSPTPDVEVSYAPEPASGLPLALGCLSVAGFGRSRRAWRR